MEKIPEACLQLKTIIHIDTTTRKLLQIINSLHQSSKHSKKHLLLTNNTNIDLRCTTKLLTQHPHIKSKPPYHNNITALTTHTKHKTNPTPTLLPDYYEHPTPTLLPGYYEHRHTILNLHTHQYNK